MQYILCNRTYILLSTSIRRAIEQAVRCAIFLEITTKKQASSYSHTKFSGYGSRCRKFENVMLICHINLLYTTSCATTSWYTKNTVPFHFKSCQLDDTLFCNEWNYQLSTQFLNYDHFLIKHKPVPLANSSNGQHNNTEIYYWNRLY